MADERSISPITKQPDPSWRPRLKPTRAEGGMHDAYKETHPAYGMMVANRVSHSPPGKRLFGSDFAHQHYVNVTIRGDASVSRSNISSDHYFAGRDLIEISMSEAQWASFVASPNQGFGVPVTIEFLGPIDPARAGHQPYIQPLDDRRQQFNSEVDERLQATVAGLDEAIAAAPTKKMREQLTRTRNQLTDGLPWVAKQFDEHAERTIEKARIEVNAVITSAIQRAGVKALNEGQPIALIEGAQEEVE